jgi:hypothetical protein
MIACTQRAEQDWLEVSWLAQGLSAQHKDAPQEVQKSTPYYGNTCMTHAQFHHPAWMQYFRECQLPDLEKFKPQFGKQE